MDEMREAFEKWCLENFDIRSSYECWRAAIAHHTANQIAEDKAVDIMASAMRGIRPPSMSGKHALDSYDYMARSAYRAIAPYMVKQGESSAIDDELYIECPHGKDLTREICTPCTTPTTTGG